MEFIDRSSDVMSAMFAVASFLVGVARQSGRRFATAEAEARALIYNYRPVGTTSYQAYFF